MYKQYFYVYKGWTSPSLIFNLLHHHHSSKLTLAFYHYPRYLVSEYLLLIHLSLLFFFRACFIFFLSKNPHTPITSPVVSHSSHSIVCPQFARLSSFEFAPSQIQLPLLNQKNEIRAKYHPFELFTALTTLCSPFMPTCYILSLFFPIFLGFLEWLLHLAPIY